MPKPNYSSNPSPSLTPPTTGGAAATVLWPLATDSAVRSARPVATPAMLAPAGAPTMTAVCSTVDTKSSEDLRVSVSAAWPCQ